MAFYNHRELNRKERSTAELNSMCRSYDSKCGEVTRYNIKDLSPEQKKMFMAGKPLKEIVHKEDSPCRSN